MSEKTVKYQSRIVANWDRIPTVEGRVILKDTMTHENKVRPFIMLDTKDGEVQVFESAGLADAFKSAEVGDFMSIEYLATVQTKNKRDFRQFRARVWEDPDAPALESNPVKSARRGRNKAR